MMEEQFLNQALQQHVKMLENQTRQDENQNQYNLPMSPPQAIHSNKHDPTQKEMQRLRNKNFEQANEITQLKMQLNQHNSTQQHLREQLGTKDQLLQMQEGMIQQLHSEIENLKKVIKTQQETSMNTHANSTHHSRVSEQAFSNARSPGQISNKVMLKHKRIENTNVTMRAKIQSEIKDLQFHRIQKQMNQDRELILPQQQTHQESVLIQSQISLSGESSEQSIQLAQIEQSPRNPQQVSYNYTNSQPQTLDTVGKDGDTIALQKYIKEDLTMSKITDQNNDML